MKKSDVILVAGGGLFAVGTFFGISEHVEAAALHDIAQTLPHGDVYDSNSPVTEDLFTQETFESYAKDHQRIAKYAGVAALAGLGMIAAAVRHS